MITEQIFYGIRCDRCRDEYESSGDYSYMTDKGEIEEAAESDEWLKIEGRHYCPHCYEEDPLKNEYDDDDHDYTPKPPIPECIFKMRRVVGMMIGQADGEMRETTDDHLHVRFYMNQHPLNDTLLAIIDEMLGDLPHTVVVDEEPHTYDKGITRRLHIDVSMNFIHKGDHIRVIEHWGYKDAFGKEGIVKKIHTNGTLTIEIRDDDGELRLRSCGAKSLEVIKKAKDARQSEM